MSRVARYKLGYVVALGAIAALCVVGLQRSDWSVPSLLILALLLLIPGRIQGVLFRDLFRARHEIDTDQPAAALDHLNRFVASIRAQPWRKLAIWLSWSVYTPIVEALTLNNIGVAHLAQGDTNAATEAWRRALALDPLYPIPHVNLAAIADAQGAKTTAEEHIAEARTLGFSGRKLDQTIQRAQSLLARIESRGPRL